ncbi:MAG: nicotinate (nicotinamide) nucleotide adenylyltransferase [Ignavibacteria bacterium]
MKIGIMGGTFNPVHTGHIAFVRAFIDQIQLDQCFIIPARRSPFRMNEPLAEDMHRLQMLQLAFADIPHTFVSDIEIKREGLSFTIDTVNEIQSQYPGVEIYLLIGEDQAHRFKEWREWKELLQRVQLCIVQRTEDANLQELIQQLIHGLNVNMPLILKSPLFHVSSTLIRDSMSNNQSITGYVPETVEEYIHSHKLYVNT